MLTRNEFYEKYISSSEFAYMLLGRMQADCEYIINACNCSKDAHKFLWASTAEEHIAYMRYLWDLFEEKPEWISEKKIDEYEEKLCWEVA